MRLTPIFLLALLCLYVTFPGTQGQLMFGGGGLKIPPINLLTVYRILRKTWNKLMYSLSDNTVEKEGRDSVSSEQSDGPTDQELKTNDGKKLLPDDLLIKMKFVCNKENSDCSIKTLEDIIHETNFTLSEAEESHILGAKKATSLDIPISEFINLSKQTNENSEKETRLTKEAKTPSFLPFPFSSAGWLASYITLNAVLLGLYILLAGPYFVSGQNVNSFSPIGPIGNENINPEMGYGNGQMMNMMDMDEMDMDMMDMDEMDMDTMDMGEMDMDTMDMGEMDSMQTAMNMKDMMDMHMKDMMNEDEDDDATKEEMDDMEEQYLGYTTYGDTDGHAMHMNDMKDMEDTMTKEAEENDQNEEEGDDMEEQYLGYTTYGDSDMFINYMLDDDDEDEEKEEKEEESTKNGAESNNNNDGKKEAENGGEHKHREEDDDNDTRCMENMLCLRPAFGGRALFSSSLLLKILEWIPGSEFIGKKFKRNIGRLEEAVVQGRQSHCHDYFCPSNKRSRK